MFDDDAPPNCPWCGSPCPDEICTCSLRGPVLSPFFAKPVPAVAGEEGKKIMFLRSECGTRSKLYQR